MAKSRSKSGKGPGGGHLLGIFFIIAMMMGVVFTLGYLLGRSQYDSQLRAAVVDFADNPAAAVRNKLEPEKSGAPARRSAIEKVAPKDDTDARGAESDPDAEKDAGKGHDAPAAPADWDYYHSAEPAKPNERLEPQPVSEPSAAPAAAPVAKSAKSRRQTQPGKSLTPPLIPRGATVLQVAALAHESDALAMAQQLRQKKFPAYVLSPDTDKYYRVQVGPYTDPKAAAAARDRLEKLGFKTIIKR